MLGRVQNIDCLKHTHTTKKSENTVSLPLRHIDPLSPLYPTNPRRKDYQRKSRMGQIMQRAYKCPEVDANVCVVVVWLVKWMAGKAVTRCKGTSYVSQSCFFGRVF